MALYLPTEKPAELLSKFKKTIDAGHIKTWAYKPNGDLFHTPTQWKDKAVMRPSVGSKVLQIGIIGRESDVTWPVYGIYHGRLIEEFLSHFADEMGNATVTAMPVKGLDQQAK